MGLIDAYNLIEEIRGVYEHEFPTASGAFDEFATKIIPNIIRNQKAVDAVPVVHGHWISIDEDARGFAEEYECSACKKDICLSYYTTSCDYEYCPICGAKMGETVGNSDKLKE